MGYPLFASRRFYTSMHDRAGGFRKNEAGIREEGCEDDWPGKILCNSGNRPDMKG